MLGNSKNNSPKGWFNFNFPKYTVKNHLKQIKACVQLILRHSHGTWPREANVMPAQIAHKPLLNTLRRKRQVYGFVVFGHPFVFFFLMSTNSKALGWIVMGSSSAHRSTKKHGVLLNRYNLKADASFAPSFFRSPTRGENTITHTQTWWNLHVNETQLAIAPLLWNTIKGETWKLKTHVWTLDIQIPRVFCSGVLSEPSQEVALGSRFIFQDPQNH